MKDIKDIPNGLIIIMFFTFVFVAYYFYLLITQGPFDVLFSTSIMSSLMWIDVILTIILLFAISYGFLNAKNRSRLFTIFYFSWSAFWDIVMISARHEVIIRYLLFVVYVVIIMYLLMSHVKAYFGDIDTSLSIRKEETPYKYGEYKLYTKDVKLRSGKTQTIYFFSKRTLDSGRPCKKPDHLVVGINTKTGMPYLKKKH